MAIIRLLVSSLQIQSVFFDFFEQKTNGKLNQTVIFNFILISFWLIIDIIHFFKQLLTIRIFSKIYLKRELVGL